MVIGIFDSGSGGLSVLVEIRKLMPKIDVIYLGDIANAPYGSKTRKELDELTSRNIQYLLAEGATKIVAACNSVAASVKSSNVVDMVKPTTRVLKNEGRKIIVVATQATIDSSVYQRGFMEKKIETLAIPELAGAIEFGFSEDKIEKIISGSLEKVRNVNFEILILGCTHYSLVKSLFEKVLGKMGKKIEIYDPALAVAREVAETTDEMGIGKTRFLITKDSDLFRKRVEDLFGRVGVEMIKLK